MTDEKRETGEGQPLRCPDCKGRQIIEVWEAGIHAYVPVFCGTCSATGYADGVAGPKRSPPRSR